MCIEASRSWGPSRCGGDSGIGYLRNSSHPMPAREGGNTFPVTYNPKWGAHTNQRTQYRRASSPIRYSGVRIQSTHIILRASLLTTYSKWGAHTNQRTQYRRVSPPNLRRGVRIQTNAHHNVGQPTQFTSTKLSSAELRSACEHQF